jgi:TonB family protein
MAACLDLLFTLPAQTGPAGWAGLVAAHSLKAFAILAVAAAVTAVMKRASASARHLVWAAAFGAILLMPGAELIVPSWEGLLRVSGAGQAAGSGVGLIPWVITVTDSSNGSGFPLAVSILLLWAIGTALVLGRFGIGVWRISRITGSARPFAGGDVERVRGQISGTEGVRVLESSLVCMPMTWGAMDAVVLLPESAASWPSDRLRMVMAHELVHVRRKDWLVQAVSQFVCAVHWFNPLVWYAAGRLTEERERACDDAVLRMGERGCDYAGHLLEMVRSLNHSKPGVAEGVAMAQSHLEGRIRAMLDSRIHRGSPGRTGAAFATAAMLCLLLPLAALRAPAQSSGTGRLSGTVRDASGATVPKASVLAIHVDTGKRDMVTTSDTGEFTLRGIPAGNYQVQVRKPGFAQLDMGSVEVPSGGERKVELTLNVGRLQERLDVTGKRDAGTASTPTLASKPGEPTRIRVGGNVQAAKITYMAKPSYPISMKQQGIEGTVLLRTVISKAGVPLDIEVLSTLAHPDLVAAAIDAVRQWRYEPTLLNGVPVEVITDITINFTLAP